jgi:hypothetical protein
MARTVAPRRQATWPSAWARKVLPTPTGPTIVTCAWASRKRSVASSLRSARSKVTFAVLVPVLQAHGGIQAGFLDPQRDGETVAPRHFVAEHLQEEILMGHLLLSRERQPFGQCIEDARQLQPAQDGFQIRTNHVGRRH